ncbi:MAG: multicopper oxidase domain-containing protein [Tatlockia sp.]|nr:multicopper oxidase domain-containing protein [Tatlockia sp.]
MLVIRLKWFIASFFLFCSLNLWSQHEHLAEPAAAASSIKVEITSPQIKKQVAKKQKLSAKAIPVMPGKERVINLVVQYKMVNYAGKLRRAISVNNQIPAPTLHFKEGERVAINVYNKLDKGTSIHWHGIILPWQMDGVENVSQKPIPPGGVFHYRFTLHQSGTYWYHAHAHGQEQEGLYGAFVIEPKAQPTYQYTKDYVVVLSDWSNIPADQLLNNLKKTGEYFTPKFPLQPSLKKFIQDYREADSTERKKLIDDYKMMQQMRMSIYDLSDVAYDAFLLNGQTKTNPWKAPVKIGDTVRLRFVGAGASTIFRVKVYDTAMQMVHIQGNDVKPFTIRDFDIAPGETYDVLVKIQKNTPYIIYAESIDTVGAAVGALITTPNQLIDYQKVPPFSEPLPVTREMMDNMMMSGMDHGSMKMDHGSMKMDHGSMKMDHGSMKMDQGSMPVNKKSSFMKHEKEMPSTMSHNPNTESNQSFSTLKTKKSPSMAMTSNRGVKEKNQTSMRYSEKSHPIQSMNKTKTASLNHSKGTNKKGMSEEMQMNHSMSMPTEPSIIGDSIVPMSKSSNSTTSGTKYQGLVAAIKTNDSKKAVDGVIRMELFGYMERFIWFINGLPEYKAKPIIVEPGKRYRIIFTNNSMMRHPMHIHGHWFILRIGQGEYDPLLHTIEVPPGATAVADFDTDASGQWFFHCHHLYHMLAGMARVFQYQTIIDVAKGVQKPEHEIAETPYYNRPIVRVDEQIPIDLSLVNHPIGHHAGLFLANFLDISEDPFHNIQEASFRGLYGSDYNKLELYSEDAEINKGKVEYADLDIFYWRLISQFWAIKGGVNYFYRPGGPYWQPGIGIEGLAPYFIDTNIRTYYFKGSVKFDVELSRDTQLAHNFLIRTGIRSILATKTIEKNEIGKGLNLMRFTIRPYYRLAPGFNVFIEYEHDENYGALRRIKQAKEEATNEDKIAFGLSILF